MKPFPITHNTMVVTSTFVTKEDLPILEISHEDDEEGAQGDDLWDRIIDSSKRSNKEVTERVAAEAEKNSL